MKARSPQSKAKSPTRHVFRKKIMPEKSNNKTRLIIVIAVIVVIIVIVAVWWFWKSAGPTQTATSSNVVTQVPTDQLPETFPPNIPLEPNRQITNNFNVSATNGQEQATRSFESLKSIAQNVSIYSSFLSDPANGWTIISESTSSPSQATFLAKNADGVLTITIVSLPPQPFPAASVSITYTTNPQ